jgi:hypothetical protein
MPTKMYDKNAPQAMKIVAKNIGPDISPMVSMFERLRL